MDYKTAILMTVNERKAKVDNAHLLYLDLMRRSDELYETEKAIRGIYMDEVYGKQIDKDALDALVTKRNKLLFDMGITFDMLNPPYKCNKCKDTGLIDGKPCSCIIAKCASDGINTDISFDKADLTVFPEGERERIAAIYKTARSFCDKFPETNKLNLIFMGKCGSGKTYLASCIANEIAKKGFGVIMLSAFAFFNRLLKYHTTFDGTKLSYLEPLLDCDLLVIDDLGSENMIKNVTVEYLFHVVNERLLAKKHTVFTTNIDGETLLYRYGDRTYSRLLGGSQSIGFALSDTDLRKRK